MAFPLRGTPIIQAFNPPGLSVDPAGDIEAIGFDVTASGNALLVSMAGAPVVVAVDLDLADDEVAIGGPDSGGTRRLFQGRDTGGGNNIIESVPVLLGAQALTLGKAEDTSHISGDVGVPPLAVRRDVPGSMVDAEDDYEPLQTDANGQLRVGGAAPTGLGKSEDAVHADGDVGVMALAVRNDAGTPLAADGDYIPLMVDVNGNLFANIRNVTPGTGATNLGKAEDAVAGSGDVGVMALVVRRDAPTAGAADGDYAAMSLDDQGWLRTRKRLGSTATTTVTAVAAVNTSIVAANTSRLAVTIQNRGPGPLYIALNAAATTSHFLLSNGESKTFNVAPGVAVNGISNGAGASAVAITEDV